MNDKKITLYYFPLNGRAAVIRAILTYLNIEFEDRNVDKEDWPELKKTTNFEFGQMPALEIDGKYFCQTFAIEVYLARKYNLLGSNDEEEYQVLSLVNSRDDYSFKIRPILMPQNDEEKKESGKYLNEFIDFSKGYFKILENRLAASGGKYMVGNKFSLADIFVTIYLYLIFKQQCRKENLEKILKDNSPVINDYINSIAINELKTYFEKVFIHDALI